MVIEITNVVNRILRPSNLPFVTSQSSSHILLSSNFHLPTISKTFVHILEKLVRTQKTYFTSLFVYSNLCHDIAEIQLMLVLITNQSIKQSYIPILFNNNIRVHFYRFKIYVKLIYNLQNRC